MWRVTGGGTWQLAQVEANGYMDSNGYVGVSWGATDIYTRNGQLSGTGIYPMPRLQPWWSRVRSVCCSFSCSLSV